MKTKHNIRAGITMLLFFAFAFAKAQIVPVISTTPACNSNGGTATITATGVSGPFYMWISGGSFSQVDSDLVSSGTFTGLPAGPYQYYIYCSSGNQQGTFVVGSVDDITITTTQPVCPSSTTGSAVASVTGGTSPYNYVWSTGATTLSVTGLPVGINSIEVTDANGCSAIANDTVQIISPVVCTINQTGPICSATLTASVTGGATPYTIMWSTGANTASITGLVNGGYYTLTITDANGCQGYNGTSINNPGIQLDSTNSITNPTCTTAGGIVATPLNGTAPFAYVWSNGATGAAITGLSLGEYYVTVTDANGCTGVGYYYLSENSVYVYAGNSNLVCGMSNGTITLSAYNGTPPYDYAWSNTSTNQTNTDTSLTAGTYGYTVTDAAGCSATGSDVLTGQGSFIATLTTTPTSCNPNTPTGTVTAVITNGGTAPFTFSWQVWDGQNYTYPVTTNSGLTGLAYGDYVWLESVTDANGCTDTTTVYSGTDTAGTNINYAPTCYDNITGYAFTDINNDCTNDPGDPGIEYLNVVATDNNGNYYYANTDSSGFYDIQVLPGTYTVSAYINSYSSCSSTSCTGSYNPTLSGTGVVSSGNNFGYSNNPSFDLVVHTGYLPSVPGSSKEYWVYYYNQGTTPATNAVLTFIHDPNLTLTSTNPPYTSYNQATQTIVWNLGTVPLSYLTTNQQVTMEFNVPSNLPLGTLLSAYDSITPTTGDCNPANNVQYLTDLVTGSHDPNAKEVSPSGNITASDSVLNYTIRFQNNGNAPAAKVVIIDTLSPLVNPASVIPGAASSKYTYTLSGNGILTFTFDPIYLPDSAQSVDSSQGFVMYSVNIRGSDAIGSQIQNTAYIYFDLNPAVVTNTTVNALSFPENIKNLTAGGGMSITVSPNPVHDKSLFSIDGAIGEVLFGVTDITGQKIFEISTLDRNITFESETFAAGVYIYTARDTKGNTRTGKIVIVH